MVRVGFAVARCVHLAGDALAVAVAIVAPVGLVANAAELAQACGVGVSVSGVGTVHWDLDHNRRAAVRQAHPTRLAGAVRQCDRRQACLHRRVGVGLVGVHLECGVLHLRAALVATELNTASRQEESGVGEGRAEVGAAEHAVINELHRELHISAESDRRRLARKRALEHRLQTRERHRRDRESGTDAAARKRHGRERSCAACMTLTQGWRAIAHNSLITWRLEKILGEKPALRASKRVTLPSPETLERIDAKRVETTLLRVTLATVTFASDALAAPAAVSAAACAAEALALAKSSDEMVATTITSVPSARLSSMLFEVLTSDSTSPVAPESVSSEIWSVTSGVGGGRQAVGGGCHHGEKDVLFGRRRLLLRQRGAALRLALVHRRKQRVRVLQRALKVAAVELRVRLTDDAFDDGGADLRQLAHDQLLALGRHRAEPVAHAHAHPVLPRGQDDLCARQRREGADGRGPVAFDGRVGKGVGHRRVQIEPAARREDKGGVELEARLGRDGESAEARRLVHGDAKRRFGDARLALGDVGGLQLEGVGVDSVGLAVAHATGERGRVEWARGRRVVLPLKRDALAARDGGGDGAVGQVGQPSDARVAEQPQLLVRVLFGRQRCAVGWPLDGHNGQPPRPHRHHGRGRVHVAAGGHRHREGVGARDERLRGQLEDAAAGACDRGGACIGDG
eukprot:268041-Pleurochrysis_carterae.AAC.2